MPTRMDQENQTKYLQCRRQWVRDHPKEVAAIRRRVYRQNKHQQIAFGRIEICTYCGSQFIVYGNN